MAEKANPNEDARPENSGSERGTMTAPDEALEPSDERLRMAERQRDEYFALLQRTQADYENYQKRNQREQAEERRYAHAAFARELLPALDNLERALEAARKAGEQDLLIQGVAMVRLQLLETFSRFGIMRVEPLGEALDPQFHEAVSTEPRDDITPGTIVRVLEPGYRLHDRVLRPAKVVVASRPNR